MSWTAGIIYSLLLYRAQLSKKNRWVDSDGRIYIQFSNASLAKAIHKSDTPVRNALRELERVGLIEKKPNSGTANIIYLKLPDECEPCLKTDPPCQKTNTHPVQKQTPPCLEIDTGGVRKRTPRYKEIDKKKKREESPRQRYGSYSNVLLTDAEYQKLKAEIPNLDGLIEQMSTYLESHGKSYKNYAAALRNWAIKDNKQHPQERKREVLT